MIPLSCHPILQIILEYWSVFSETQERKIIEQTTQILLRAANKEHPVPSENLNYYRQKL